jgi:hypothetical protein
VAQVLLSKDYSPDDVKVLRGGWISWQSLGYPSGTSEAPPATPGQAIQIQPGQGSQPIQVVPGATVQIGVGTPVPGGVPAPPNP